MLKENGTTAADFLKATEDLEAEDGENLAVEKEEEEEELSVIEAISKQYKNAPSVDLLEGYKIKYGNVQAFCPNKEDLYLFRALSRLEHKTIGREIRRIAQSESGQVDPDAVDEALHESVVKTCLLYPRVDVKLLTVGPAGLLPTLYGLILEASLFLDQQRALQSTFRL